MEHEVRITSHAPEADEAEVAQLLDGFWDARPDVGAVVSLTKAALTVAFALDAEDAQQAAARAEDVLVAGYAAAGLTVRRATALEATALEAGTEELQPA